MFPKPNQMPDRKRRVGKACDQCRIRKIRCDGSHPCARCEADNKLCVFTNIRGGRQIHPAGYTEMLEARVELLTRSLLKVVAMAEPHLPVLQKIKRRSSVAGPTLCPGKEKAHSLTGWANSINDLVNYLEYELSHEVLHTPLKPASFGKNAPPKQNKHAPSEKTGSTNQLQATFDQTSNLPTHSLQRKPPLINPVRAEVNGSSMDSGRSTIVSIPELNGQQLVGSSLPFQNNFPVGYSQYIHGPSLHPKVQRKSLLQPSPPVDSITSRLTKYASEPNITSSYLQRQLQEAAIQEYALETGIDYTPHTFVPPNSTRDTFPEPPYQSEFQPDLSQLQVSEAYFMDAQPSAFEAQNAQTVYFSDALTSGSQVGGVYSS